MFESIFVILTICSVTFVTTNANKNILIRSKNVSPTVELASGLVVKGTVNKTSGSGKTFHAYRGIPYALPPVGDLRFRPPVPLAQNLSGQTVDALQDSSQCIQFTTPVEGNEDCLYINVYVPIVSSSSEPLPVMVWIYGGAFISGNSSYSNYGPDYFLNENVIFVSFNYRLGVFGFLSTEDETSPGNYGLKDQILALHWVQNNIENFGGNNSRVTVFSESAGAASTSYLSLTPLTAGLFQQVILESGTAITLWALTRKPKETAMTIAASLQIDPTQPSETLVDALRKADYKSLANAQISASVEYALKNDLLNGLVFGPTIEPNHPEAVVTNYTHERLKNGMFHRIPYLMGFNSQEGIPFEELLNYVRGYLLRYDLDSTALVPSSLNITNRSTKVLVNSIIRHRYFGYSTPITLSKTDLTEFISDDQFNRPITESALLYSQNSLVYFYEFSYDGPLGSGYRTIPGVGHADELNYLFKRENYPGKPTAMDILTRKRLIRLWTNFAKTGNPTPTKDPLLQNVSWTLANVDKSLSLRYLNINRTLTNMANPKWDSFLFWLDLFKLYGNPPYNTY